MNIKNSILALTLVTVAALGLTGCGGVEAADKPDPAASVAAPAETPEVEEAAAPAENPLIKQLGEVVTYTDGVSISVSQPAPYAATEYANGADQANQVVFTIVLTNGSDKPLEPGVWATVSSGGVEASPIIDIGNEAGAVSFGPDTTILPGQTIQWLQSFSIADLANITVELAPGFEYENAIFTNIPF